MYQCSICNETYKGKEEDVKQNLIIMAQTSRTGKTSLINAVKVIDQLEQENKKLQRLVKQLENHIKGD